MADDHRLSEHLEPVSPGLDNTCVIRPCVEEDENKLIDEDRENGKQKIKEPQEKEDEQSAILSVADTNEIIYMDYFALSDRNPTDQKPQTQATSLQTGDDGDDGGSVVWEPPELDWIEPSTPFRSCVLATSEDDDSSSKSCSDDPREGTGHQSPDTFLTNETAESATSHDFSRDKENTLSPSFQRSSLECKFATRFNDVSMEVTEESVNIDVGEDAATKQPKDGNGHWSRRLGAWLADTGRVNIVCSLALAASVVGLILVGNGWQRFRLQCQKLRCRIFSKGKGFSYLMYQHVQIKESSANSKMIPVLKARSDLS